LNVLIVKLSCAAVLLFIGLAAAPPGAEAGTTQSFTLPAGSYTGSRERKYKVYIPTVLAAPAPMVMALHGCEQTNDDVLNDWGLTAAADRFGFLLVAPFITTYDGFRNTNCWGFWLDNHRHQGRGEVEDLHRIGLAVEGRFASTRRGGTSPGFLPGAP
jgi:poly(3-hydroxybutyrate) depolymerase